MFFTRLFHSAYFFGLVFGLTIGDAFGLVVGNALALGEGTDGLSETTGPWGLTLGEVGVL